MKTITVLSIVVLTVALLALGVAAPVAAWDQYVQLNDSQEPGSVLVFPKFIKGTVNNPDQGDMTGLPRSQFKISVVRPNGVDEMTVGTVRIKAHWVCPGGPPPAVCAETDFHLTTTIWGTVLFNAGDNDGAQVSNDDVTGGYGDPQDIHAGPAPGLINGPPCREGYLIAWVVDGDDNAIKFDGLIGNAVIRSNSNSGNSTRSYNAIPIQAADELYASVPPLHIVSPSGSPLVFDGSSTAYKAVTSTIYGPVRFANVSGIGTQDTNLVLLTLDVVSSQNNPQTDVFLTFYAQDESPASTFTNFFCWGEVELRALNMTEDLMGSSYGLVRSTGALQGTSGVTLLGLVESRETFLPVAMTPLVRRDYTYPLFNDSMPVTTTFTPH